jgi:hypothetical protein
VKNPSFFDHLKIRADYSKHTIHEIPLKQEFHLAGFDIQAFPVCHDAPETIEFLSIFASNTFGDR